MTAEHTAPRGPSTTVEQSLLHEGYDSGMAAADVPDLSLVENDARPEIYRSRAKLRSLDAHPSLRPMVTTLLERYRSDRPDQFGDGA